MGDTEYDPRIFKTRIDRIDENPKLAFQKAELAAALIADLANSAGK
jgi:hypothetical protein